MTHEDCGNIEILNDLWYNMYFTRVGIVIVGLIMLAFAVCGDIVYLKSRYRIYQKVERKQIKKAKRELKLMAKETNKAK